jgi:signal transduction histidine kinase
MEIEIDELRQALAKLEADHKSDITDELRIANAELARAAQLENRFLANMSHELRTPLGSILGMSEVLRAEIFGSLNGEQRGFLKHIHEAGHRLLSLINDLLDLSKIGASLLELNFETVPIPDLCQSSLHFVQQQALEKQIKLISNIDPQVNTLEADTARLKQILVNLLSNAIKFTPSGGQVGLEVAGVGAESAVHFTVWDTGTGISEVDIQRLFQPFVQLDHSYGGIGLGLALVYRLAELHGGSVRVESQVGQGSRFTVSIPWRSMPFWT